MTEPMLEDEDDFYTSTEPPPTAHIAKPEPVPSQPGVHAAGQSVQPLLQPSSPAPASSTSEQQALASDSGPEKQGSAAADVSNENGSATKLTKANLSEVSAVPTVNQTGETAISQLQISSTTENKDNAWQAKDQLAQTVPDEAEAVLATIPTAPAEGNADESGNAPEFEADSSPYESSSDDSSSSEDSSDEDSSDEEYAMLDPREQARILMADAGSDDEGGKKEGGGRGPRTQNEHVDEIVEMPSIEITADIKIEELGHVQVVIDNVALIKAKTSGEYQVLESSSVLCFEDRKLIGVVAETIGRVEEPMYVVRFTNPTTLKDLGVEVGKTVFYVPSHSHFLFTRALQVKGSDASNLHDEEVAANEVEFSDDEAEAAHKASLKKQRQAKKDAKSGGPSAPNRSSARPPPTSRQSYSGASEGPSVLSYDDNPAADDLYTPLTRPALLMQGNASDQRSPSNALPTRGGQRGRGRGRGGNQGGRGRGHTSMPSHSNAPQNFGPLQQAFNPQIPTNTNHSIPQQQQQQQQQQHFAFGNNVQGAFAPFLPQQQPIPAFQQLHQAAPLYYNQQPGVNLSALPQFTPSGQQFPVDGQMTPMPSFPDQYQHQQYSQPTPTDPSQQPGDPAYYGTNYQNYQR